MTEAYNHERDVLATCGNAKMSRIIKALDSGSIVLNDADRANTMVQFLIFEMAACDVRDKTNTLDTLDVAWVLRSLHSISVALTQLHSHGIAHQDLKPSNVLIVSDVHKLCDLGRASTRTTRAPHDDCEIAGDHAYAPPELLYGYVPTDWQARRLGCDLYLLGSMVVFFFTLTSTTSLLLSNLSPSFHPSTWQGSFPEVLPYLVDAFDRSLSSISDYLPSPFHQELLDAVSRLCDPDPSRRGHAGNALGERFSLHRFVSLFNLLARKAELKLYGNS